MNNFIETPRFPTGLAYGTSGGPQFRTSQFPMKSGAIAKNKDMKYPLQVYNALKAIKRPEQFQDLRDFFYAAAGAFNEFRFKDPTDHLSCRMGETPSSTDQLLGIGDGVTARFPLRKSYTVGSITQIRPIRGVLGTGFFENYPLTVSVASGAATGWTYTQWDDAVVFSTGAIPATGQEVRAGFEYDVIVSFGIDQFDGVIEACESPSGDLLFNVPNLPLMEQRKRGGPT